MAVIRKDDRGLYANVGGYIVRPLLDTQYKEGDHVDGHHYGGTTTVGMGKNKDTPKREYEEYWRTDWKGQYDLIEQRLGKDEADRFLENERTLMRLKMKFQREKRNRG